MKFAQDIGMSDDMTSEEEEMDGAAEEATTDMEGKQFLEDVLEDEKWQQRATAEMAEEAEKKATTEMAQEATTEMAEEKATTEEGKAEEKAEENELEPEVKPPEKATKKPEVTKKAEEKAAEKMPEEATKKPEVKPPDQAEMPKPDGMDQTKMIMPRGSGDRVKKVRSGNAHAWITLTLRTFITN